VGRAVEEDSDGLPRYDSTIVSVLKPSEDLDELAHVLGGGDGEAGALEEEAVVVDALDRIAGSKDSMENLEAKGEDDRRQSSSFAVWPQAVLPLLLGLRNRRESQ
jgi:hypothetical protein